MWSVGAICQRGKSTGFVARYPSVDGLTSHAETLRDFGHLPAVLDDGHDRLIALLHDAQLH
jgi:hypothetical protein